MILSIVFYLPVIGNIGSDRQGVDPLARKLVGNGFNQLFRHVYYGDRSPGLSQCVAESPADAPSFACDQNNAAVLPRITLFGNNRAEE